MSSPDPHDRVIELLRHTDKVAEIQNSLRSPVMVEPVETVVSPS